MTRLEERVISDAKVAVTATALIGGLAAVASGTSDEGRMPESNGAVA